MQANLGRFLKEVNDVRAKPAEAKQLIERLAKEYDFHLETMETAKDQWSIAGDPALKDLREAFAKRRFSPITTDTEFAKEITKVQGVYQLFTVFRFAPNAPPELMPNAVVLPNEQIYLYWLVEDNPVKARSFEAAKADVEKAWKRAEERKLARKKAEEIVTAVQKQDWPTDDAKRQSEVEAFLNKQKLGKAFVLDRIARQIEKDSPKADVSKEYVAYKPKETDIKYPPEKFTDTILSLQKPGDATYMQDKPETTLYVVVLLSRVEPTFEDFKQSYARAGMTSSADSLWTSFVQTQRDEFKKKFIEKMREEAAPEQTKNGQWDLPKDIRRGPSRTPTDED
jgi:hypothetical protein